MPTRGPDYALLLVGFLLFGGATYGLVSYEGDGAAGLYNVAWGTRSAEVGRGPLSEGSSQVVAAIPTGNLARFVALVQCGDTPAGAAAPATITVRITGPDGFGGEGTGTCGQDVTVPVTVNPAPSATQTTATSETAARESFANADLPGQGDWTIAVTTSRAVPILAGTPAGASGTITATAEYHEPTLTLVPR